MKGKFLLFILIFTNLFINAQEFITEISCLGEVIKTSDFENPTILASSKDVGTIFTINENTKTIKVKTSTRYNLTQDNFNIENTMSSEYAKIYTCSKNNDNSNYFISVLSDKVTIILEKEKIVKESPIISINRIKVQNQIKNNDYIYHKDWKEINVENVLKRSKLNSKITGTYEKNEDNILQVVELTDGKIFFKLGLYNGRNLGNLEGLVDINEKLIFEKNDFGLCKFEIKIMADRIEITTIENGDYCGYGNGISSDGIFYLKSNIIPNMEKQ